VKKSLILVSVVVLVACSKKQVPTSQMEKGEPVIRLAMESTETAILPKPASRNFSLYSDPEISPGHTLTVTSSKHQQSAEAYMGAGTGR